MFLIFHVKVFGYVYEILRYKLFQDTILLIVKVNKVRGKSKSVES